MVLPLVQRLLYAHGDVKTPIPETVKVLDEILTDFIQGIAFEAARVAQYSGRQKLKLDDFQFIFRKNPVFLGKLQETFEKKHAIDVARKLFTDEDDALKDASQQEKSQEKTGDDPAATAASSARPADEELGAADDDADAEADMLGR
jgi:transcription initiation factor TFIID subunit 13